MGTGLGFPSVLEAVPNEAHAKQSTEQSTGFLGWEEWRHQMM